MLDEMRVNDIELTAAEIGALESADEVAHLFAKLGYNVDNRTIIPNIATLGLDSEDLRQQIFRLELLAVDPTVEFLKRDDTQAWLEDPGNPKNRLPADDYMQAGLVAKTALGAAESKRFFHWELEFPEVFFAPSTPGGQDVKLRADGGLMR